MSIRRTLGLIVVSCLLFLPTKAWSQASTGSIAGVVKDMSGAVLPGVTVEAASPALIEKVRTVVTDDRGEYRIVELRPGPYTVTFTLPGFATVKREGIELTTSFTATVNAELRVGGIEETITVSGQTPVVDISSARQQTTVSRTVLDAIPTTKRLGQYASIIPGATYQNATQQDVGGTAGEGGTFAIHGQRVGDQNTNMEGMSQNMLNNDVLSPNAQTIQEIVVETGATSAEASSGGVQINVISKDGGNALSGSFSSSWAGPSLQSDNMTDDLAKRGLLPGTSLRGFKDNGGALGGPFKRDKLWFFTAHRFWGSSKYIQGSYYNKLQNQPVAIDSQGYRVLFYEPDLDRHGYTDYYYHDDNIRLTWQATPKHKIAGSFARQDMCNCPILLSGTGGANAVKFAPEGARTAYWVPIYLPVVTWSNPATNRLLLEASVSMLVGNLHGDSMPEVGPNDIAITDTGLNLNYGSRTSVTRRFNTSHNSRFAVSYVTGSHTFKTGYAFKYYDSGREGRYNDADVIHGARAYVFNNRTPRSVTIYAQPFEVVDHTTNLGLYAQDQWAVEKLTVNLGLRYDAFRGTVPPHSLPAGIFVPARDFPAVDDVPNFKNLNPRASVIYDVFGDGETALKASLGRYIPVAFSTSNNPASNQATSVTRTWNDQFHGAGDPRSGNYVPDCDLANPEVNGECGVWGDRSFGQLRAGTRFADDAMTGFNKQFNNWQASVSMQHQLRPGVALNVGYFRTWYDNFLVTDNEAVSAADFDTFCVTRPTTPARNGYQVPGAGQPLCGFRDMTPTAFVRRPDNVRKLASNLGNRTEVYNGVDVTMTARFGRGGQFSGGLSVGRTVTDACEIGRAAPETMNGIDGVPAGSGANTGPGTLTTGVAGSWTSMDYCRVSPPWSAGTQAKLLVVYPLPWALQVSAIYQNISGIPIMATYPAPAAVVMSGLPGNRILGQCAGRPTCTANTNLELIGPGASYEDRQQQLDLRFSRSFALGRLKVRANADLANVTNQSNIYATNTGLGQNWLVPYEIMGGRLMRLTGQLEF